MATHTTVIKAQTGQQIYPLAIEHILQNGLARAPRDVDTLDAGCVILELKTPCRALPLDCGRDLNVNIAAAEAIQLIGGFSQPDLLLNASINFAQYLNGDGFHGAYGSRIRYQGAQVVDKLMKDPDTRQAVITLWDPALDNIEGMLDYPCTVMLQFETDINNHLCMNVVMRSNDAWLGLPYDLFQFAQLQFSIANALNLRCGTYRHIALSLHLYERDVEAAHRVHAASDGLLQPKGVGRSGDSFATIVKRARVLTNSEPSDMTASEGWYRERFASYMG